jgi:uncharacterized protein YigA (DUF484 family)
LTTALDHDRMNVNNPITEEDIATVLIHTPSFFERHAEVLTAVQLTSPHGNRAVSLQERQAEMLREKIKGLEHRIMDMVRHGNENVLIADKLQRWARGLLRARVPTELPQRIVGEVQSQFGVPQAALKVWGVAAEFASQPFAQGVSNDAKSFASSLTAPFCGVNPGIEAVQWLADPGQAMSVALLPLRTGELRSAEPAFGLLVLASPDPQRFESGMGTDFLERIAEMASAALSRLQ